MPKRYPAPQLRSRRARRAGSTAGSPGQRARSLLQRWALLLFGLFVALPVLAAGSPTPRALTQVTVQRWLEVTSHVAQDEPTARFEAEVDTGDDDSDLDDEPSPAHALAPAGSPTLVAPRSVRLTARQALGHQPRRASRDTLRARGPPATPSRA